MTRSTRRCLIGRQRMWGEPSPSSAPPFHLPSEKWRSGHMRLIIREEGKVGSWTRHGWRWCSPSSPMTAICLCFLSHQCSSNLSNSNFRNRAWKCELYCLSQCPSNFSNGSFRNRAWKCELYCLSQCSSYLPASSSSIGSLRGASSSASATAMQLTFVKLFRDFQQKNPINLRSTLRC